MLINVPMTILFNQPSNVRVALDEAFSCTSFLPDLKLTLNTDANTLRCFQVEARF